MIEGFFSEKTSTCRLGAMGEFELLDKVRNFQVKKWKRRDLIVYIVMTFIISIIFFLYLYSFRKIQIRHNKTVYVAYVIAVTARYILRLILLSLIKFMAGCTYTMRLLLEFQLFYLYTASIFPRFFINNLQFTQHTQKRLRKYDE